MLKEWGDCFIASFLHILHPRLRKGWGKVVAQVEWVGNGQGMGGEQVDNGYVMSTKWIWRAPQGLQAICSSRNISSNIPQALTFHLPFRNAIRAVPNLAACAEGLRKAWGRLEACPWKYSLEYIFWSSAHSAYPLPPCGVDADVWNGWGMDEEGLWI